VNWFVVAGSMLGDKARSIVILDAVKWSVAAGSMLCDKAKFMHFFDCFYLVMIGLFYKAYPDGCQQVLLIYAIWVL